MSASVPYQSEPFTSEAAPADATRSFAKAVWWLALGASVFSVVLGVVMLVWPEATLKVVAALFGVWLLLHGIVRIVQAITATARDGAERALLGVIGVFFVVAGVIALRNLLVTLTLLVTLVGLMWLIGGILELISAFGGSDRQYRGWGIALGVISIVAALVVLLWPDISVVAFVYLTGAWLIFIGLIQVGMVFWARRAITA
ncbi:HdeD family acid-resistance protein [Actinoplanes sp. NPDC049668]|uniref:HdeD family acid-resistance protein n=1 Tax=unclassified Actinoplanes TaxID=2626549 RepID=UPI0033B8F0B2